MLEGTKEKRNVTDVIFIEPKRLKHSWENGQNCCTQRGPACPHND